MTTELQRSLADLVAGADADHVRIASALVGRPSTVPSDRDLAALHRDVVVSRALDTDATAMELLVALADRHPVTTRDHAGWLAHRTVSRTLRLDAPAVDLLSLAS